MVVLAANPIDNINNTEKIEAIILLDKVLLRIYLNHSHMRNEMKQYWYLPTIFGIYHYGSSIQAKGLARWLEKKSS
jgi:hypothetical protein